MSGGSRRRGAEPDERAIPEHLRPRLSPEDRRAHLRRALDLFRSRRFYDAHDAWEVVWRSTTPEPRDLIQALIQITVAFHHLEDRGRPDVAARVLAKAAERLERQEAGSLGIDLEALRAAVEEWRLWCTAAEPREPRPPELEIVLAEPGLYG